MIGIWLFSTLMQYQDSLELLFPTGSYPAMAQMDPKSLSPTKLPRKWHENASLCYPSLQKEGRWVEGRNDSPG